MGEMGVTDSHFWFRNAYTALFDALPDDRPSVWVEVGVFEGASFVWLARQVIQSGKPVMCWAIDNFLGWPGVLQGDALREAFQANMRLYAPRLGPQFALLQGDSVAMANCGAFPNESCDVVWLDADHSYDAVKADIAAWYPKVRPGGALGGDDWAFGDRGVERAVTEAFPKERIHLINGEREGQIWPSWIVRKPITPHAG